MQSFTARMPLLTATSAFFTEHVSEEGYKFGCLTIHSFSLKRLNAIWHVTLIFCMCMYYDHSLLGTENQGHISTVKVSNDSNTVGLPSIFEHTHTDWGESVLVLFNGVIYTVSVP